MSLIASDVAKPSPENQNEEDKATPKRSKNSFQKSLFGDKPSKEVMNNSLFKLI